MSLVIIRAELPPDYYTAGQTLNEEVLPGRYEDRHTAEDALGEVLKGYEKHGENAENAHWWARDATGPQFMFFIRGANSSCA